MGFFVDVVLGRDRKGHRKSRGVDTTRLSAGGESGRAGARDTVCHGQTTQTRYSSSTLWRWERGQMRPRSLKIDGISTVGGLGNIMEFQKLDSFPKYTSSLRYTFLRLPRIHWKTNTTSLSFDVFCTRDAGHSEGGTCPRRKTSCTVFDPPETLSSTCLEPRVLPRVVSGTVSDYESLSYLLQEV